ncbi:hypothetical protein AN963_20760 [Brevibacillus choshinensis]|uniref:Uncharacterized protein n=1 Tax=Brevibacillus choshinensis TaxID=54911 RepID=A0ABR5N058_BRECH|nr:hypothetical protein [Brevibacillus choshinensis]KQL43895.1 hypothetical protein AN963_20760 [Brevibacillus choshinensis]
MTEALAQLPNTQLSKTIGSLALLKTTWEVRQTDYIDNFVPFLATLIKKQKYLSINVNKVCDDFKNEFGLIIPYHPMIGLINRAQKKGLIKRGADSYEPVWEKIESIQFEPDVHDQLRKIEYIIDEMISFNHRVFAAQTSREEAESNILSFLKEYDVDIIYDIENNVFPNVTIASKNRFFTYRFIQNAYKSNPKIFEYIMDLAIGSVLANSILNNDIVNMSGKLSGINLYFDTRFILRLLGTEGEERSESYQEFLKLLSEEDAKLYIFNHTYDEIIGILKDSKRRIRNTKTDYSQASPVLLYFIQKEFNESDIDRFITKVELVISANNISIQNAPEPEELKLFQIDYDKLLKTIVGRYKRRNPSYNEKEKEDALLKDVKSIEAIYKFRKGKNPKAINDSVSIFITTNTALAQAVKSFGLSENVHYRIPACITDVLLGTILWLQSPTQVTKINEKKIIADCIAALQPNEQLLRRFLLEVDKLQQEKMIDEREVFTITFI